MAKQLKQWQGWILFGGSMAGPASFIADGT